MDFIGILLVSLNLIKNTYENKKHGFLSPCLFFIRRKYFCIQASCQGILCPQQCRF